MILADTSVWIEHLRHGDPPLRVALDEERVLVHPLVIGEPACGNLRERESILDLLGRLPLPPIASDGEAHQLVRCRALIGRGLGWIDLHLLASAAMAAPARLWTHDKRLAAIAEAMKLS